MKNAACSNAVERQAWAVGLSFAAASLLNLEALHPGACAWLGLDPDQSFALCAVLGTVSVFLGGLILARLCGTVKITVE